MPIGRSDVGCWIVKGSPTVWNYLDAVAARPGPELHSTSWSLSPRSSRSGLIEGGDLIALWITGPKAPGIYEFGRVTSDGSVDWPNGFDPDRAIDKERAAEPCRGVEFDAVRLDAATFMPREQVRMVPSLQGCEQLRVPRMPNPGYLTPAETTALAGLLAERVPTDLMAAVGWPRE